MAEKRMLTKKVTDDDRFMTLSSSAQALYLHLSMAADDDGFCNQITVSMFKAHASMQDLQALLENRYIYQFENGVIVIRHWRMANALRKDRYTPTVFQNELKRLELDEGMTYEFTSIDCDGNQTATTWQPLGNQTATQIRIDKNREDKNRLDKSSVGKADKSASATDEEFERFWKAYPRKDCKKDARKAWSKLNPNEDLQEIILGAIEQQKSKRDWKEGYIPYASTWLNGERWNDKVVPQMTRQQKIMSNFERAYQEALAQEREEEKHEEV